jgi:hypothetical protein
MSRYLSTDMCSSLCKVISREMLKVMYKVRLSETVNVEYILLYLLFQLSRQHSVFKSPHELVRLLR